MAEDPLVVDLDGPACFVGCDDYSEACALALRAAGYPVISGLRIQGCESAHMLNDDDAAPPCMRGDPYWVLCNAGEPGAVAGWLVRLDVESSADLEVAEDAPADVVRRLRNGDLLVPVSWTQDDTNFIARQIVGSGSPEHVAWVRHLAIHNVTPTRLTEDEERLALEDASLLREPPGGPRSSPTLGATLDLASDPFAPWAPCVHILADDEIIATVYYDDGDTSDGSPPRGPAAWLWFRNERSAAHDQLDVPADPDAEPRAIQAVLTTLGAHDGLRPRGIGWAASYDALPWQLVDEPNPSRLVGGLYRGEVAGWLAALRADT